MWPCGASGLIVTLSNTLPCVHTTSFRFVPESPGGPQIAWTLIALALNDSFTAP